MSEKILCIDDDPNVLQAYQRALRKQFCIEVALGGEEGLAAVVDCGPYAVVVSDMRMPGMSGVQVLARIKELAPNTVRMMLTGNSDQQTALEAVNEGHIFRFVTKPCAPETFAKVLQAGIAQFRLLTAERDLLSKTLGGSIKMLTDVLAMVQPLAFGRVSRVQRLVRQLCEELKVPDAWQVSIAAMLCQVGCVAIPEETLSKVYHGQALTEAESDAFRAHPRAGQELIANIPRLEDVAEIVGYQEKLYDGRGFPADHRSGDRIPLGSRILKLVSDWDTLMSAGTRPQMALAEILDRKGYYDPVVVKALARVLQITVTHVIEKVSLCDLTDGMIVARDISSARGTLLCAKGQELTSAMRLRLRNYAVNVGLSGAIMIFVPMEGLDPTVRMSGETASPSLFTP